MRTERTWKCFRKAFLIAGILIGASWAQAVTSTSGSAARVAVFEGIAPTTTTMEPPVDAIRAELSRRGLPADVLRADRLMAGEGLSPDRRYDLLIIPRCEFFPAKAVAPLLQYLESGGRMLLIGGRPFSKLVTRHNNAWLTEDDVQQRHDSIPTEKIIVSFSDQEVAAWRRASGTPANPTRWAVESSELADAGAALRVSVVGLKNYDTLMRTLEQPFPDDPRALTCFWARGDKDTPQLSLEWVEKDGSRWIATVALSGRWRHYVLAPQQFRYWRDNPSKGRGGAGDCFDPRNAQRLVIGLSDSHTKDVKEGDHTYWIADVGWSHDLASLRIEATSPDLEILSPWYKTFVTDQAHGLRAAGGQVLFGTRLWPAPAQIVSPVARPTGAGFAPSRAYRWIPLIIGTGGHAEERGTAASVLVWRSGRYARSAWGFIGIPDALYLREHPGEVLKWIGTISQYLAGGVFLGQGGAEDFCCFTGEPWTFRVEVLNRSDKEAAATVGLRVREAVARPPDARRPVFSPLESSVRVAPGGAEIVMPPNLAESLAPGVYRVEVRCATDGRDLDRIEQLVRVLPRDRKPDPRRLVRVRGGNFEVNGKPWVPFGINFWPLHVTGLADMSWRLPRCYEPERVQRDLERVRACGMNVVCIQFSSEEQARPTMDFLERCRALDIRAFVSIPGGYALTPRPQALQRIIRAGHLAESDAVFAYDVAWEPVVGDEAARRRWDGRWRDWIVERYGSVENAEKDWEVKAPRDGQGRVTGPPDAMILDDGPHRVMVAAYRRFLDDAISQGYGVVERAIGEVDPNHLIGVRSGYGGTGNPAVDARMPFDLASGAKHLDFISPEGYGHGPSWESVRSAGLTTLYGRMVGGGKPVWWAEYGWNVYPNTNEGKLARQGELYANFARMFRLSRANGGAGWWFPGGYRVNEDSDYGIFNPDGTPRPAALANQQSAVSVARIRLWDGDYDVTIKIDRDLHPRGYSQIRARHEAEYLAAVEAGKSVALATEATGTNSADTPLVAVGNRPYNGNNPPKYLNAEFEQFWIKAGDGEWREVQNGERIPVAQIANLRASQVDNLRHVKITGRAKIANTGEAAWLVPKDPRASKGGGVYLVSTPASDMTLRVPLATETPFLGDTVFDEFEITRDPTKDSTLELELEAASRARFGQHFRLSLLVR